VANHWHQVWPHSDSGRWQVLLHVHDMAFRWFDSLQFYIDLSQICLLQHSDVPLCDRGPVNSFFIKRGPRPGPTNLLVSTFPIFFKFIH
jgi:hypothetical protein